jgi:hypothetical protein
MVLHRNGVSHDEASVFRNPGWISSVVADFVNGPEMTDNHDRNVFELARILITRVEDVAECRRHIEEYCELAHVPEQMEDLWSSFVYGWEEVRFPKDGIDRLQWAMEETEKEPIPLPKRISPPSWQYAWLYSVAAYLGSKCKDKDYFFLPTEGILADRLGVSYRTMARYRQWLVQKGLIEKVGKHRPPRNGKEGMCTQYKMRRVHSMSNKKKQEKLRVIKNQ